MISRLEFDPWQLLFPAIGFCLFAAVFICVVIRAGQMRRPSVDHLQNLPLEEESSRAASHVRTK